MVTGLEGRYRRSDLLDDADALMSERAARRAAWHVALQNMQIGSANRCVGNANKRITWFDDRGFDDVIERFCARAVIDKRFHIQSRVEGPGGMPRL